LSRQLDVHHIIPFRKFGIERYQEANSLSNLICYCNLCHLIVERTPGTKSTPSP
jgi:predicted HNH restriction endonuclease